MENELRIPPLLAQALTNSGQWSMRPRLRRAAIWVLVGPPYGNPSTWFKDEEAGNKDRAYAHIGLHSMPTPHFHPSRSVDEVREFLRELEEFSIIIKSEEVIEDTTWKVWIGEH